MKITRSMQAQAVAVAVQVERDLGYVRPGAYKRRPINYIDVAPKPFIVQIPLVEYFERVTRLKADRWQKDFLGRLQASVENMHIKPTYAEYHAEPQLGKTRGLSQLFPAWCFGHAPLFRYVLAMYNISRSEAHSDVIIQIMRSDLHKDIFPNKDGHLPTNAAKSGWMTNARRDVAAGQMDAQKSLNPVGLESGMTGSGMDWLTIDDPYKEPKDAFSENMWENLDRFWRFGVQSRLSPHTCVAAMFHRYNYDDFGGYLLNTGKFDYVRYATIADGSYFHEETGQKFDDPLGRKIGEYICPERRQPSYYTANRADSKVWLSMFQGRPGKEEGDFFQVDKIEVVADAVRSVAEWARCSLRGRGWDHAATQGSGDQSSGGLMGMQSDGTVIIADVFSGQLDSASRVAKQREIAEADGLDVTVVIPEGQASDGKDVVFLMQQNLQGFNVVARKVTNASPGSDAKKRRAHNFSVAVNSGKAKFLSGDWVERVKRLMRRFGNVTTGDDEVDALSDVYNYLYEEFHKGLVIKDFSEKNLQLWKTFADRFGSKVPAHWTVYAALKVTPEENTPNSGVIVARAAENSGLKDFLFVVDEYKEYTSNFSALFNWLDMGLKAYCANPRAARIWLHPDSEGYASTIRQKMQYGIGVFKEADSAGIVEANWYVQNGKLVGLVRDPNQLTNAVDSNGLAAMQQEAFVWGFNEKGEPTKMGQVWDCLRIITHQFKTYSAELTDSETIEAEIVKRIPALAMNAIAGTNGKGISAGKAMARYEEETRVRKELDIPREDWSADDDLIGW